MQSQNSDSEKRDMTAQELYDILADTVGVPTMKHEFIHRVDQALKTGDRLEYRFMGHLGFGGKLWLQSRAAPYVTCYQEDETAHGRKMLISLANEDLAEAWAKHQQDVLK